MQPIVLECSIGVPIAELRRTVAEISVEMNKPGPLRAEASNVGINLDDGPQFVSMVRIEPTGHGISVADTAAVVTLTLPFVRAGAKVTETILIDLWRRVVLPRILQRLGDGALVPRDQKHTQDSNQHKEPKPRK